MIPKAKQFFQHLDEMDATIVAPTPLLTELLMESDATERGVVLIAVEERFHIADFDAIAAKYAAEIWNTKKRAGVIAQLTKDGVSMRTKIKVDMQIIAVAMASNANVLYTEDDKLKKLAEGSILVRSMPAFNTQTELFFDATLVPPAMPTPAQRRRALNMEE